MRKISYAVHHIAALLTLGALTACLDLPIEGQVSGESMSWISTSLTVEQAVVDTSGDASEKSLEASALSAQVLLSDFIADCDGLDRLAAPDAGLHTLALSLAREDNAPVEPGEYWIGGAEGAMGTLSASFLTGDVDQVLQEDALSGVLVVTYAAEADVEGELHLEFPGGKLRGYFSSTGCPADAGATTETP